MKKDQRTSAIKPVSDGLARELGRMMEDAARKYSGGSQKAELVKGSPDLIKRTYQLWDELATEQALRLPIMERPIWKTLKLGNGLKSSEDFITAIEDANGRASDWAKVIMNKPAFTASDESTELDLVIVTVAELGFPDGAKRQDIYDKAISFGLSLCPPEAGPQLRLQYMDQPKSEWLFIAMEPITGSDGGGISVFNVNHRDNVHWLSANYGAPGIIWYGSSRWVFCRRK